MILNIVSGIFIVLSLCVFFFGTCNLVRFRLYGKLSFWLLAQIQIWFFAPSVFVTGILLRPIVSGEIPLF